MPEAQTTASLMELIGRRIRPEGGSALEGPEGIEEMARLLEVVAEPGFVTVMVSKDGVPEEHTGGVAGFRKALEDWISPYETFRLEIQEVIPLEDKIVFVAVQRGTTKHGGVEVETGGTSIWHLEHGRVTQTNFYLDQRAALKAAGLNPDQRNP
jgi:ketosteroid isomerase-like protein